MREECVEPHLTFLVPALYMQLRHGETDKRHRTLCRYLERRIKGKEADPIGVEVYDPNDPESEDWVRSYLVSLAGLARHYESLSSFNSSRFSATVPYRSSSQKKNPLMMQATPINLHLQLMTAAPYGKNTAAVYARDPELVKLDVKQRALKAYRSKKAANWIFVKKILVDEFGEGVIRPMKREIQDYAKRNMHTAAPRRSVVLKDGSVLAEALKGGEDVSFPCLHVASGAAPEATNRLSLHLPVPPSPATRRRRLCHHRRCVRHHRHDRWRNHRRRHNNRRHNHRR